MGAFQAGIGALVGGHRRAGGALLPGRRLRRLAAAPRAGRGRGSCALRIGAPLRFDQGYRGKAGWTRIAAECEAAVRALGEA